jgi:hypothetical protein
MPPLPGCGLMPFSGRLSRHDLRRQCDLILYARPERCALGVLTTFALGMIYPSIVFSRFEKSAAAGHVVRFFKPRMRLKNSTASASVRSRPLRWDGGESLTSSRVNVLIGPAAYIY